MTRGIVNKVFIHTAFLFSLTGLFTSLQAEPWKHPQGWWIDPPQGWKAQTNDLPALVTFSEPEELARFQVFTFESNRFADRESAEAFFSNRLKWTGDIHPVAWGEWSCSLASGTSTLGGTPFSVMAGFYHHPRLGSRVCWGTVPESYAESRDGAMKSLLDSMAPEAQRRYEPGLIGRGKGGFDAPRPALSLMFGGEILRADFRPAEIESAQRLVRRERNLLLAYAQGGAETQYAVMNRFYRMVYRNAWSGFTAFVGSLEGLFRHRGMNEMQKVGFLTGAVFMNDDAILRSDTLETPFDMLIHQNGDCDSKTLLLTLLLDRLSLEGEFLLSLEDHHAFIGLPARYLYGKQTVFLEGVRGNPLVGVDLVRRPVTNVYFKDRWRAIDLRMD